MSNSRPAAPRGTSALVDVLRWLEKLYRWVLFVDPRQGSFTGTLTGFTTAVTGTIDYTLIGDIVTLSVATNIQGTSNATTMTMTGMPAIIYPKGTRSVIARILDNTTTVAFALATITNTGTITFNVNAGSSAFTNVNTKGLLSCTMVYKI